MLLSECSTVTASVSHSRWKTSVCLSYLNWVDVQPASLKVSWSGLLRLLRSAEGTSSSSPGCWWSISTFALSDRGQMESYRIITHRVLHQKPKHRLRMSDRSLTGTFLAPYSLVCLVSRRLALLINWLYARWQNRQFSAPILNWAISYLASNPGAQSNSGANKVASKGATSHSVTLRFQREFPLSSAAVQVIRWDSTLVWCTRCCHPRSSFRISKYSCARDLSGSAAHVTCTALLSF